MPSYEFKIGEAFPARDPVARFITVLAMINNDWLRTTRAMEPAPEDDGQGVRLLFARQQFAYYYEATNFLDHFREYEPAVDEFVNNLDASAQRQYRTIMALRQRYGERLRRHRNTTFHYPKDQNEIAKALRGAGKWPGTITVGRSKATVRFGFADEVSVQFVFQSRGLLKALREARLALGDFVGAGVDTYVRGLESGVVRTV